MMKELNNDNLSNIDEELIGIYSIKNTINDKYYIGQSITLKKRLKDHIKASKIPSKKSKYPLYLAINKYGIENFYFEILYSEIKDIEKISDQRKKLNELETKYIIEYNSYNNGYNQTLGSESESGTGTFGYKYTEEQKKNLSNIQKELAINKEDTFFVFEIDTKKCLEFKNGRILRNYYNLEDNIDIRRTNKNRNKSGFSIHLDKFLFDSSKEGLKEQIIKLNEYERNNIITNHTFQEITQNVYCYNYILKCYYTFYSLTHTIKVLNKNKSTIYAIKDRENRSDDGWIISLDKNRLEELKLKHNPSKKVLSRYSKAKIEINTYPQLSINIEKDK